MHPAAVRLAGLFDALARAVEVPAVKGATQAVVFEPAKAHVGAAMRAGALDQAQLALAVAKQHEIFAQQAHRHHRTVPGKFVRQRGGLPVAAQDLARRGAGGDAGNKVILFLADHVKASAFVVGMVAQVGAYRKGSVDAQR